MLVIQSIKYSRTLRNIIELATLLKHGFRYAHIKKRYFASPHLRDVIELSPAEHNMALGIGAL